MSKIDIVEATDNDKTGIFSIDSLENDAYSINSIESMIHDEKYYVLVAKKDSKVVGYIALLVTLDEAELIKIVVESESRKMGLATRLTNFAFGQVRSRDVRTIYLEVRIDNSIARKLYENLGFIEYGKRAKYYNGIDAILYRLNLN